MSLFKDVHIFNALCLCLCWQLTTTGIKNLNICKWYLFICFSDHQIVSPLQNGCIPNARLLPNAMLNGSAVNPAKNFGVYDQSEGANFDEADEPQLNGEDFGTPSNLEELKVKVQEVSVLVHMLFLIVLGFNDYLSY